MYAIIAISRLCQDESLKGLKDQRHSTRGGGGAGGCCIQGPGPAASPGVSPKPVRAGVLRWRDLVLNGMVKLEHLEVIAYTLDMTYDV